MAKIIEITYSYKKKRKSWYEFYTKLEEKIIFELKKNNIDHKIILFRGINYKNLKRLIETGYDLHLNYNFYAGAIAGGQHTIRTALEYGYHKKSNPLILKKSKNQFIITCYNKDCFDKNEFQEESGYNNYNWTLKDIYSYKQALQVIFLFKPAN